MNSDDAALRADELLQDSRWIHRIARSLLADPSAADDLVQEAWVAALAQEDAKRDESGSPRSWLARVLRNLADKRRRSEAHRWKRELSCARGEAVASTADLVARAETQRMVVEAVLAIPEPFRTTILLAHIEGLSSVEIARSQGISDNTVRWRIQRGLALLRFELERKRGREWLHACALLLSPADRAAIASAVKAATAGFFAATTPKAAAAALTVVALASGATVMWSVSPSGSATGGAVAALEEPRVSPHEAPEEDDALAAADRAALRESIGIEVPASRDEERDVEQEGRDDADPGAASGTLWIGPRRRDEPGTEALAEQVRSVLVRMLGPGPTSDAQAESVLKKIDDALISSGVGKQTLEESWTRGGAAVLAVDLREMDASAVVVMKPFVYFGPKTAPPR
jgi:RNA polymerase sigma-70 factor (ECF subfamily)